jgi:hypothetical protein
MFTRRSSAIYPLAVFVVAAVLAGCGDKELEKTLAEPLPSPIIQVLTATPTVQPTRTPMILGQLFDPGLDLNAGPVDVPLELQIPALKVNAPVLGVGLTSGNVMDAPKGPIGDAIWYTAFWYRGSGIPGEPGTATFGGHIDDPLGQPEIFAHLQDLTPGDLIIVHYDALNTDILFTVDQVKDYSIQESSTLAVLAQVYGAGPVAGTGPQPAPDGLSHLTLITCDGNIFNGEYDHHTVVYATRRK